MTAKRLTASLIVFAIIALVGLGLFPPWATVMSGNGYPRIGFRWIGSPPPPVGDFAYQVDIGRLQWRLAIAALFFVAASVGIACMRKLRKRP